MAPVDFGPAWPDAELGLEYEGDYGDTFIFGASGASPEAAKCAAAARQLFGEVKTLWKERQASGEAVYAFLDKRATELGYRLHKEVEGHRLADFPHHKYSKERLSKVPFFFSESLWILEVMLVDPQARFGAFFEDLL